MKSFEQGKRSIEVLRGVDLEIFVGEVISIMGASGAGKSTFLHLVGALDKPTEGSVKYEGEEIFSFSEKRLSSFRNQNIGFIFQFHHLLKEFSALENVIMPGLIGCEKQQVLNQRGRELLSRVGLADRLDHRYNELSGGEQQRVAVARALINSPKVVLADEPTGNLDAHNSEHLYNLIFELNKNLKQTFVIITHQEKFAKLANRVFELAEGKLFLIQN